MVSPPVQSRFTTFQSNTRPPLPILASGRSLSMKRLTIAAAAIALAAPLAAPAANAEPYNGYGNSYHQRDHDNRAYQGDSYNQRDHDNRAYQGDSYSQRGYDNRAYQGNYGWNNQYQGHRSWRRGDRLSGYDQSRFRAFDYRREHFREPPRGYRYMRDDRGDTLLVGILSGVVLSAILNGDRY